MSFSEHRLRQAIDASGTGIWDWDVRTDRQEWSDRMKVIFGLAPEHPSLNLQDFVDALHPDDRQRVEDAFRGALRDHTEYLAEYRIAWPDGSEHWVAARGRGEYAADGEPLRMIGAAREITGRKRAELTLQLSEERFRTLVEATAEIVWLSDPQGAIFQISPAFRRYTGLDPAQAIGAGWLDVIHPDDRAQTVAAWTRALNTGEPYENEFRVRMAEGGYRHFRANSVPLRAADGSIREWVGTAVDIQERKLAREALEQANAALLHKVSEHRMAEAATHRLNRVYAVLSGINTLIVHARSQQELFDEACRIAVEQGRFRLAWIGLVNGDVLNPVSIHGENERYLAKGQRIELSADTVIGRGPTATALRDKRPVVCNDIATDPIMAPWRELALSREHRSSADFPLLVGQRAVGCLSLYSTETGFFDEGEMKLLAELAGDISYALEFLAREEKLDYLAYYDSLTRLANRRLFSDRLNQLVHAARHDGKSFAVMMLDLASFKSINDLLGMAAGDELLRKVAHRLTRYAGGSSRLARVGGDRFAAVLPDFHAVADLNATLHERMWKGMGRPYRLRGRAMRVSVRVGIAMFPDDGDDAESLIQNAEAALKKAKASGDNFLFYTQQMSAALKEKLQLEGQLRHALENAELVLHYQPKLDLRSGAICGAEALLRWNSPDLGLVPPARFMPLLEETGLIVEVGRWVLRQASQDRRAWAAAGLPPTRVAVNLSPLQLRQAGFVEDLRRELGGGGPDAAGIDLEVTESVLMPDMEQHIGKLSEVRGMGVRIAIDDFGIGYSSLSRLSRLPVDAVKIDRSFIVGMTDSADTMSIVSTIISLARSMNLSVVAEGVDSAEQLKFLRLLRCDEIQGFLFSPGVPADEFARMLREGRQL